MVDDYMLDNIKKIIGMEKLDDTKILIEVMVKYQILFQKNVVILITRVIKNDDKFYSEIFYHTHTLI